MNRIKLALIAGSALFATPAFAQDATEPAAGGTVEAGAGAEVTTPTTDPNAAAAPAALPTMGPPLTLGAGKLLIAGSTVNINMSADNVGKPISLAPSIYYGVSEKLTLGLTHDNGTTLFTPRPSIGFTTIDIAGTAVRVPSFGGICLNSEEDGCYVDTYSNVGLDALYSLKYDKFSVAGHGGLDFFKISDPSILQLRVGVLGRYMASDKIAIVFDPRITIGLTERDSNKEAIDIPLWFWYDVNGKLGVYLHSGIAGPFDGFGDAFTVPVQIGGSFKVNEHLTAGLDFSFVNLLGKDGDADGRVLALRAAYAL